MRGCIHLQQESKRCHFAFLAGSRVKTSQLEGTQDLNSCYLSALRNRVAAVETYKSYVRTDRTYERPET